MEIITLVTELITEPLSYPFMQRALMMSLFIGVVSAIFSCFLVLKGWSLMGDAVSHAVLPGIGIAYLLNIPLLIGAFGAGAFCAFSIGLIKNYSRVKEDAVMGIVFSGMFAVGLIMVSKIETDTHLLHVLFGNVLGVSELDLWQSGIVAVFCSVIMLAKRHDFLLYCFDPTYTQTIGLRSQVLHYSLLLLLSLTIVSAIKAAGIILVIAMLIAPGACALLLCRQFDKMLLVAVSVAVLSCLVGVLISYHFNVATAPVIVLIQMVCFVMALLLFQYRSKLVAS